mgnify:CR=1 FL=1
MTDEGRAIARLEAQMQNLAERWEKIEPLLLARSGDLQRIERIEQDLNGLGDKYRASSDRIAVVEERQREHDRRLAQWAGILTGVIAVLQAVWAIFGESARAVLFGAPK